MKPRNDLLDEQSPKGIEVFQITEDPAVPACHIYMEAQIFAPDSRRFLLHCASHAHGADWDDPRHAYLVCDLGDGGRLTPIIQEPGAKAPSVSPDGKYVYYFVDRATPGGGRFEIKRVGLDGTDRTTIMVVDTPLPGSRCASGPGLLSCLYPLSTISSDGKRLAISGFLGDGTAADSPWGLAVFDLQRATGQVILDGPDWCNVHPQYCRSTDGQAGRDILVQHNHGMHTDVAGKIVQLVGGDGADIHMLRDDGSDFRNLPWGRDGNEFCQGHQCWRGRSEWCITSTSVRQPAQAGLIESLPVPYADHIGLRSPGGVRNDLSRSFEGPNFYHFATDEAGRRLVSDGGSGVQWLYLADLGQAGRDALANWRRLLNTRNGGGKNNHLHPFLSPDGKTAFFNSNESGILQAYLVTGLDAAGG